MKNNKFLLGFFSLLLTFGLILVGCDDGGTPSNNDTPTPVTFSTLTANGTASTATTTALTLTFSEAITDLAAADITVTGATKGELIGSGTTYKLGISGLTAAGNVTVGVSKSGYAISPASKEVAVHFNSAATAVTFSTLTANGTAGTTTTTELTLTFSAAITSLTADDITVTNATKGSLTGSGTTYTLEISNISAETVGVEVVKANYTITPSPKTVTVNLAPAAFSVSANGTAGTTTTTALTLTFDRAITGLTATDITLTPGSTGATKGILSGSGTTYTLAVSGITAAGSVGVTVAKTGVATAPQSVNVNFNSGGSGPTPVGFSGLAADGTAGTTTTTELTLTFDTVIAGLTAGDITLTPAGSATFTVGSLDSSSAPVYKLGIASLSAADTLTVGVAKSGYTITPASKNIAVHHVTPVAFSNLAANGTADDTTTTELTLTFDTVIAGLTAGDITLTATGSATFTVGSLDSSSAPVYILEIASLSAADTLTVGVAKSGYTITPASKNIAVHHN